MAPLHEDVLEPATLVLEGQSIHAETAPSAPLYQINRDVTSITISLKGNSSVIFERVEHEHEPDHDGPRKIKTESISPTRPQQQTHHLCYLVHPTTAQHRAATDSPAYYLTSMSPSMPGNISLETSKPSFPGTKPEFKAQLSAQRTATHTPLFDDAPHTLFTAKPNSKWKGGRYRWTDPDGGEVALEGGNGKGGAAHTLVVTVPMRRGLRDALVATWVLRLWHDTAESREAKRAVLESLAAPTPPSAFPGGKSGKRVGALGALAAGGGGGGGC